MEANQRPTLSAILDLLALPKDGRLLAFGATTSEDALGVAAERPDILIVLCDTTSETTRDVSDRALASNLNNIVVGDTHAGPPVDRALFVGALASLEPAELVTLRSSVLPGGYCIFVDSGNDAEAAVTKLRALGYTVADVLDSPITGHAVIRAR